MAEPKIAGTKPIVLELEPGNYFYCTCGLSENQPFCNGSHKGTDFKPMKFTIEEKQRVAVCACKYSNTPPFCDGTHKKFSTEQSPQTIDNSSSELRTNQAKTNKFTSLLSRIFKKTPSVSNSKH
jgi:CDGSH-type Zn-finger protein